MFRAGFVYNKHMEGIPKKLNKITGDQMNVLTAHKSTILSQEKSSQNNQVAESITVEAVSVPFDDKERTIELVKKSFDNTSQPENAFENYRIAKEAGLKVVPTYRLEDGGTSIYMTNLAAGDRVAITGNNTIPEKASGFSYEKLPDNFNNFLSSYFEQATIATLRGLKLYADMPMFTFDTSNSEDIELDFFIADFDTYIADVSSEKTADELIHINLDQLQGALLSSLSNIMNLDNWEEIRLSIIADRDRFEEHFIENN